eukprot:gene30577-37817_t
MGYTYTAGGGSAIPSTNQGSLFSGGSASGQNGGGGGGGYYGGGAGYGGGGGGGGSSYSTGNSDVSYVAGGTSVDGQMYIYYTQITANPTASITTRPVSVVYEEDKADRFKIVLPFLFASPPDADFGLADVTVHSGTNGTAHIVAGSSALKISGGAAYVVFGRASRSTVDCDAKRETFRCSASFTECCSFPFPIRYSVAANPSVRPSPIPSMPPTTGPSYQLTLQPTTRLPSFRPTQVPFLSPTKYPLVRPTLQPTSIAPSSLPTSKLRANYSYEEVSVDTGGVYERVDSNSTNFVINISSVVNFVGRGGVSLYTIIPRRNSTVVVNYFNVTSDLVDLKFFRGLRSMADLNISQVGEKRFSGLLLRRRALLTAGTVTKLTLDRSQYMYIANVTGGGLTSSNFDFATVTLNTVQDKPTAGWTVTVALEVAGCALLFVVLVYQSYVMANRYKHSMRFNKIRAVDFESARESNATFLNFSDEQIAALVRREEEDAGWVRSEGASSKPKVVLNSNFRSRTQFIRDRDGESGSRSDSKSPSLSAASSQDHSVTFTAINAAHNLIAIVEGDSDEEEDEDEEVKLKAQQKRDKKRMKRQKSAKASSETVVEEPLTRKPRKSVKRHVLDQDVLGTQERQEDESEPFPPIEPAEEVATAKK